MRDHPPPEPPPLLVKQLMLAIGDFLRQRGWVAHVAWKRNGRGQGVIGIIDPKEGRAPGVKAEE